MIIGLAETMQKRGINYQQCLHVTAVDLDPQCVNMSYVQFSLLHIPAVVVHGNTLSMEEFGHWYTPAHIMGLWDYRLMKNKTIRRVEEVAPAPPITTVEEVKPAPTKIAQLTLF